MEHSHLSTASRHVLNQSCISCFSQAIACTSLMYSFAYSKRAHFKIRLWRAINRRTPDWVFISKTLTQLIGKVKWSGYSVEFRLMPVTLCILIFHTSTVKPHIKYPNWQMLGSSAYGFARMIVTLSSRLRYASEAHWCLASQREAGESETLTSPTSAGAQLRDARDSPGNLKFAWKARARSITGSPSSFQSHAKTKSDREGISFSTEVCSEVGIPARPTGRLTKGYFIFSSISKSSWRLWLLKGPVNSKIMCILKSLRSDVGLSGKRNWHILWSSVALFGLVFRNHSSKLLANR